MGGPTDEELNSDSSMRNYGLLWLIFCIPVGYIGIYEPWQQAVRQEEVRLLMCGVFLFVLLVISGLTHVIAGRKARYLLIYRKSDISLLSILFNVVMFGLAIGADLYFEYFPEHFYGYDF
jgi:hypothetical protein